MKRDGTPTTTTYIATTTWNVFDDEETPELRHRDYDADDWRQYGTGEERMDLSLPGLRVRYVLVGITFSCLVANFGHPPPLYTNMRGLRLCSAPNLGLQDELLKQTSPPTPQPVIINPRFGL